MRATGLFIRFGTMVIVLALLASCAASKRQDGFSYQPKYAGPDMQAGGGELEVGGGDLEVGGGRLEVGEQVEVGRLKVELDEVSAKLVAAEK